MVYQWPKLRQGWLHDDMQQHASKPTSQMQPGTTVSGQECDLLVCLQHVPITIEDVLLTIS